MHKLLRNKKAQQIFVALMISIMVLILIIILSPVLRSEIAKSVNGTYSSNLSTSNAVISVGNKATIIIIDLMLFYFIGVLIACSICYITGKRGFSSVITAIMVFLVTSVLISPLKTLIVLARDSSHLNCASTSVSIGVRLSCIVVDVWLFYFIITLIASAFTYIFITKVYPRK